MNRRLFLQKTALGGGLVAITGTSLLRPLRLRAGTVTDTVFSADNDAAVLRGLFGDLQPVENDRIRIDLPGHAALGYGVALKTWADIDDIDTVAILTAGNAFPLNAYAMLSGARPYFSARIRVERSSAVSVYFGTADALYSATRQVKISTGGYGMHIR